MNIPHILVRGAVLAALIACSGVAPAQTIDTFAGGGRYDNTPALEITAGLVTEVASAGDGSVYFTDALYPAVYRLDRDTDTVTQVAGDGIFGFSGDGGPAVEARISQAESLAVDAAGNLYIGGDARIRKIDTSGTITTVAGNGQFGFSGDGGPAASATIGTPTGIAFDSLGNLYFADPSHHRIRRIDTNGIITTVAGNGTAGYSGDGMLATTASLDSPTGVAVDGNGNIYIADRNNYRVRMVLGGGRGASRMEGFIVTFAGNGIIGLGGDGGPATSASVAELDAIAADALGNVYISDQFRVRQIDTARIINTVAGTGAPGFSGDGGPATDASITPDDIAVDAVGNIFIADNAGNRVREVTRFFARATRMPAYIFTVAGNGSLSFSGDDGPATDARFFPPQFAGLEVDNAGNVYIADEVSSRVRRVDAGGTITAFAGNGTLAFPGDGNGDGGLAVDASITSPSGIVADNAGNVFIADVTDNSVRRVDSNGIITRYAGSDSAEPGFTGDDGPATSALLQNPLGLATDSAGNLYIADQNNFRVRRVDAGGTITTFAGNGALEYSGDGGAATDAGIGVPTDVAVDAAGNVYIADTVFYVVRRVDADGNISTFAGNGTDVSSGDGGPATAAGIGSPRSISFDTEGNLYVADNLNDRLRKIDASGTITTIAGTGSSDYTGDGGPAAAAGLPIPSAVAAGADGSVYVASATIGRIRRIAPAPDTDGDAVTDDVDNCTLIINADQRDTDIDGIGNACDADLNNDCIVNFADLGILKQRFFTADADADLDGDGFVNFTDLGIVKQGFFAPPGPAAAPIGCRIATSNAPAAR